MAANEDPAGVAAAAQGVAGAALGAPERVAPGVRRMRAPNPGPMTAEGTNAYLVGDAAVALIDPGPDRADWRAALLDAVAAAPGGRLAAILVTHTHLDHSAGARALADATGAPIYAFGAHGAGRSATMARIEAELAAQPGGDALGGREGADRAFQPDRTLADGAAAAWEDPAAPTGGWRLTARHTPGHLGNHLCFALSGADGSATGVLFSGDHVMGWATSLVSPPDGDMGAFMASLETMAARQAGPTPDRLYLPGHGAAVADPTARVAALIAHRRGRETQIRAALADGPATADALAARIYTDVDPRLLGMAARNVLSHLIDLTERGLAAPQGPLGAAARFEALHD